MNTEFQKLDTGFDWLLVHSLNIGAGSCHAVQCLHFEQKSDGTFRTDSEAAIVDCGSHGIANNTGDHYLPPSALAYLSAARILEDPQLPVVVTHPDVDHYNYLPSVLLAKTPSSVNVGGDIGVMHPEALGWLADLRTAHNVPVNGSFTNATAVWAAGPSVVKTFTHCGGANVQKVTVNTGGVGPAQTNLNSAVLMAEYRDPTTAHPVFAALLPGDAEGPTETSALAALQSLFPGQAQLPHEHRLVAASHHGADSQGSNSQARLNYVQPTSAVYSSGTLFGHPRCATVTRFEIDGHLPVGVGQHLLVCGVDNEQWNIGNHTQHLHHSTYTSGSLVRGIGIPKNPGASPAVRWTAWETD